MTTRYSVAIIGAGPTGLVLANLLGKSGVRTLLVEANAATVGEPRAVSIDDETLRVVQGMGLLDVVRQEIVSGYGSEYRGPDGKMFLQVKPQAQPYGHPRRNAFRQPIFEAQLREGLKSVPSVETRFECRAGRFIELPDGVRVALENADGSDDSVEADFLIGCDGSWSAVREALGYLLAGSSLDERWLIIDLEDSPSASPETIVYCNSKRPGIMLPGPRRTRRYEFKLMPGETDEMMLADDSIEHLLATHGGVPGSRIIRKTVYHFHARIADHWGRNRVWLAGDAAHLMPPFAGQGMNGGVRDAANLAWKLAAIVHQQMGPRILESYERERRGHVADMIRLALRMGAIFGPKTAMHGRLIRAGFRALGIWPAARTYFAEMKYKPAPRFNDGFLLEGQLSRRGIVGRLLPQPPLPTSYGNGSIDTLLGDGFGLLGVDVDEGMLNTLSLGTDWDALVPRRIALASSDVPAFRPHSGKVLLVRPDRYVMARFELGELAQITQQLEALLADTWRRGSGSGSPKTGGAEEGGTIREGVRV